MTFLFQGQSAEWILSVLIVVKAWNVLCLHKLTQRHDSWLQPHEASLAVCSLVLFSVHHPHMCLHAGTCRGACSWYPLLLVSIFKESVTIKLYLEQLKFDKRRVTHFLWWLVSWYFDSSQTQRITSGLKTMFNLSPTYSARKSSNDKFYSKTTKSVLTQI